MDNTAIIIFCLLSLLAFYLITRWWFWKIAGGLGAIASGFSMIASIFHFQILAAMGFLFLMMLSAFIYTAADEFGGTN